MRPGAAKKFNMVSHKHKIKKYINGKLCLIYKHICNLLNIYSEHSF